MRHGRLRYIQSYLARYGGEMKPSGNSAMFQQFAVELAAEVDRLRDVVQRIGRDSFDAKAIALAAAALVEPDIRKPDFID